MTGEQDQNVTDDSMVLPEGEPLALHEWEQGIMFLFALVIGFLGVLLLFASLRHHLRGTVRTVAGLVWIGVAFFFFQAGRAGLVVEKDGVTLRGVIRRRRWTWHEINGFEIGFMAYLPSLKIYLSENRHARAPGFKGRTAKDRDLADRRVAELNRRARNPGWTPT